MIITSSIKTVNLCEGTRSVSTKSSGQVTEPKNWSDKSLIDRVENLAVKHLPGPEITANDWLSAIDKLDSLEEESGGIETLIGSPLVPSKVEKIELDTMNKLYQDVPYMERVEKKIEWLKAHEPVYNNAIKMIAQMEAVGIWDEAKQPVDISVKKWQVLQDHYRACVFYRDAYEKNVDYLNALKSQGDLLKPDLNPSKEDVVVRLVSSELILSDEQLKDLKTTGQNSENTTRYNNAKKFIAELEEKFKGAEKNASGAVQKPANVPVEHWNALKTAYNRCKEYRDTFEKLTIKS